MKNIYLTLLLATCWLLGHSADNEIIVFVKKKDAAPVVKTADGIVLVEKTKKRTIEDIYKDNFFEREGQIYIDSKSGPVPLFGMDVVYNKDGEPVARMPDPYTYDVISNPNDYQAMVRYLDWKKAVIRRTRIAMNKIPDMAYELGYITPEALQVKKSSPQDQMMVGDMQDVEPRSLGTDMYKPEELRDLGMTAKENPVFPGKRQPSGVEVFWFYYQRCEHCHKMARDWFAFQRKANEAGYQSMSICTSKDNAEVAAQVQMWKVIMGDDAIYSKNWLDWNNLIGVLNIERTPTTIFVNHNTNVIARLEGPQSVESLAAKLAEVGGWENTWPPPKFVDPDKKQTDDKEGLPTVNEKGTLIGDYE